MSFIDDSEREALSAEYRAWLSAHREWAPERDAEVLLGEIQDLLTNTALATRPAHWAESEGWLRDYCKRWDDADERYWARWDAAQRKESHLREVK